MAAGGNQLAIYNRGQGFELGKTENKSSKRLEWNSTPGLPDCESLTWWTLCHTASLKKEIHGKYLECKQSSLKQSLKGTFLVGCLRNDNKLICFHYASKDPSLPLVPPLFVVVFFTKYGHFLKSVIIDQL